jgi:type I restriction enzyme S subunit
MSRNRASWQRLPVASLCEAHVDCVNRTAPVVTEPTPFKMLRTTNVRNGYVDVENVRYVTEEVYKKWTRRLVPKRGDVILTREAPLGDVGKIRTDDKVFLGQRLYHFRPDSAKLDADFLLYSLLGDDLQSQIRGFGSGSTVEHMRLEDIPALEINVPSPPIQRRIAGILSAYDELIENSQRRIKILEAMAHALYREALGMDKNSATSRPIADAPYWRFISENVSTYAGTKRYYATADIDGLAVTGPGIDYSFSDKPSRAQKQPIANSVWFARMKDTYKIAWYGPLNDEHVSGVILSSGFAGFEARDPELWPLLFLILSSKEFHVQKDLYCTGATQMSLTNEGLARIMLPLPSEQSARLLGREAGPMLNAIEVLQRRNENLRRTRDLLLPRLLSGQIDMEAMPA